MRGEQFLDPDRISLARARRGLTKSDLARKLEVTPRTVTRYETDGAPVNSAELLSQALGFPMAFFSRPGAPMLDMDRVSFRAARRAGARQRHAAVAAGALGVEIDGWISTRFNLPQVSVPEMVEHPVKAARDLRTDWSLGTKPLPNAVQLAESKGIRVYTLPPIAEAVDAYSTWYEGVPYIFLSRRRSPERMRFDVAHELGHLVLHGTSACDNTELEREADRFASEFLMPRRSIPEYLRQNPSVREILQVRSQLKVSAMALTYAAHSAGRISDWQYRQLCIDLTNQGYRSGEPGGMPRHEMSRVFPQVLTNERASARDIANDLNVPVEEVRALTFGVELRVASDDSDVPHASLRGGSRHLRVV
ncbi:XRE family transcriptional regulator [Tsukamurella strandjordii]|uniref:XRE family transcriptional regulator n=1 Tax=Tsukamurella strandjordii TaxID=147577 RepID=A0AA90SI95_9ACTN|nr:XRE family transcriptional regulator [Tsukamurella strandjordii]MDP0399789.1 XRE family transcriptional regulator [Tsukamurella strandjordii]